MNEENKNEHSPEAEEYVESTPAEDLLRDVVSQEKTEQKGSPEPEIDEEDKPKPKKKREHKKLRHGAMSTVYTIVFVAAVVLVNIIAGIFFEKYPISFDLTKNNKFSISDDSKEYVKGIKQKVTIKIFAEEDAFIAVNDYTRQANEVITRCCEYNDNITAEYIDIDSNPDIVSEYSEQSIAEYGIIVETPSLDENGNPMKDENGKPLKRIRTVSLMDMISFNSEFEEQVQGSYGMTAEDYLLAMCGNNEVYAFAQAVQSGYVEASTADQAFVSALMNITDPDPVVVSVLTGRGEAAKLSYLRKLLLANGYTVEDVNITTDEIPADTDLCVIPAPTADYMDAEIEKVDNFLNNNGEMGKNLLYIASYQQQETPNIDELLEEYYIEIGDGVICENDAEHFYTQNFITIADQFSESFAEDIDIENSSMLIYGSRPIKLLADEKGKQKMESYVLSTENAYVADMETGEELEHGQQTYAAMSSKAAFTDDGGAVYSNLFVLGSDGMVSDEFLMFNQFQNRSYILSVLNGMTGKRSVGITIEPKVIKGNIFDITAEQIRLLKIVFIGVIPAVTLATGLIIWLRRKNR